MALSVCYGHSQRGISSLGCARLERGTFLCTIDCAVTHKLPQQCFIHYEPECIAVR